MLNCKPSLPCTDAALGSFLFISDKHQQYKHTQSGTHQKTRALPISKRHKTTTLVLTGCTNPGPYYGIALSAPVRSTAVKTQKRQTLACRRKPEMLPHCAIEVQSATMCLGQPTRTYGPHAHGPAEVQSQNTHVTKQKDMCVKPVLQQVLKETISS